MKNNPMLKDFYELTALEVYSKKERAICDVMKQKLTALGLEVEEDDTAEKTGSECGNIIAVLKGNPEIEPILFSCHLDRERVNGDEENIRNTARFVREHLPEPKLELLPYHSYGADKYTQLGLSYDEQAFRRPTDEELARLRAIVTEEGVEAVSYR